ncbi:hypothetical protein [Planomicrobium sp. CPCC 101079]|uniref:hypothetical protein n=1 Tax=Planomicrobium sp. CPCC 101079 TaxID=2599618 RepID=UPI0011B7E0CC|nr:hypothetical protein [Planomicrobium sp. CPCC 101079]TWT00992.1 hypothetical protein FQV28_16510 [Planomicrobium sp. CPCC 101079]
MENTLYRLITSTEDSSIIEKETYCDYLDYEEALLNYNKTIEFKISGDGTAGPFMEKYFLINNDYESNPSGQWHRCELKNEEGSIVTMRIEPIQFYEAEYFASKDIEARYKAIYGENDKNSFSFFTKLFKRKR